MADRPNIVFIMSDQQRQDTLACYGADWMQVPNLNALARASFVFENAYVAQPVCTPARATIMTGLYPHTAGPIVNQIHLSEDTPVIAEMISDDYYKGYMGKWHLGNDLVESGAFTRTLKHQKGKVFFLNNHDARDRLGVAELEAVGNKLKLKGHLNLEKQNARDALSDMRFNEKHGVALGLSIGFDIVKDMIVEGVRRLKELKLFEVSLVTFPMNEQSLVTGVKMKAVVPFQDLPLASTDREWTGAEARKRMRTWSSADEGPKARLRRGFAWWDAEEPENFGSFKLPIADIVDGRLMAIPKGIFAAAEVIQGARGGIDIPGADMAGVRRHLGRYYAKLGLTPPWEGQSGLLFHLNSITKLAESHDVELDEKARAAIENTKGALNSLLVSNGDLYDSDDIHSYDNPLDDGPGDDAQDFSDLLKDMQPEASHA